MVLRMWQLLPGGQDNWLFEDLVWDTSQGCTASSLQQHVANVYTLPVEKTEIAKYFPHRLWMPLSSQVSGTHVGWLAVPRLHRWGITVLGALFLAGILGEVM